MYEIYYLCTLTDVNFQQQINLTKKNFFKDYIDSNCSPKVRCHALKSIKLKA